MYPATYYEYMLDGIVAVLFLVLYISETQVWPD